MTSDHKATELGAAYFEAAERAIEHGGERFGKDVVAEFNVASEHVVRLLDDAVSLYERCSFGPATFLALTALEEIAKAEMFGFRQKHEAKRGRDPLRSHAEKHAIAVRFTVFMDERLVKALGKQRCDELHKEAETGGLVQLREAALYFSLSADGVITPQEAVSQERAREILLVAIEAADDILIGWTNASYGLTERLDRLFASVAG